MAEKVTALEDSLGKLDGKIDKILRKFSAQDAGSLSQGRGRKSREDDDSDRASPKKKSKAKSPRSGNDGAESRLVTTYAAVHLYAALSYKARNRNAQGPVRLAACEVAWEQMHGKGQEIEDWEASKIIRENVSKKITNQFTCHRKHLAQFNQRMFVSDLGTSRFDMMVRRLWGLDLEQPTVQNIWPNLDFLDAGGLSHQALWKDEQKCNIFRNGNWRRWWSEYDIRLHYYPECKELTETQREALFFYLTDPQERIKIHKEKQEKKMKRIRTYCTLFSKFACFSLLMYSLACFECVLACLCMQALSLQMYSLACFECALACLLCTLTCLNMFLTIYIVFWQMSTTFFCFAT